MTENRFDRYRRISEQLGDREARALLDRLQVLALTQPDALREFEAFLERNPKAAGLGLPRIERRRNPDRRKISIPPVVERRMGPRRASERPV